MQKAYICMILHFQKSNLNVSILTYAKMKVATKRCLYLDFTVDFDPCVHELTLHFGHLRNRYIDTPDY